MIFIKRLISLFAAAVVVLSALVATDAIRIDGVNRDLEWENAETITFYNNNNGAQAGIISCFIDGFDAYFHLQIFDYDILSEDTKAGFILCIEGEEIFKVTSHEQIYTENTDKYCVETQTEFYDNSGFSCEAKVGIKNGIGNTLNGTVCFIDNEGIRSNVHPFSFGNEDETQPAETETTIRVTTTKERTTKTRTTKERTTKEITTKNSTTRKTTTQKTVTEITERTTVISDYPRDRSYTDSFDNTNGSAETYFSDSSSAGIETESQHVSKMQYYYADSGNISYNAGKKIKTAVCIVSGVGFLLLSVWGGAKIKSRVKKDKEKADEESDKD